MCSRVFDEDVCRLVVRILGFGFVQMKFTCLECLILCCLYSIVYAVFPFLFFRMKAPSGDLWFLGVVVAVSMRGVLGFNGAAKCLTGY